MSEICATCGQDHDLIRETCRRSLFATARILCQFSDMVPHFHGRLASWVENNIRTGNRKMLILSPRVVYKTSLLTIAGSVWLAINNPEVRILIVQASAKKVTEVMDALRNTFKSDVFVHYFPELVPGPGQRFNETEIELPHKGIYPEPTISARGINSTVVGGHYNVHILDDVIDENAAVSQVEMDRAIRWFKNSSPLYVNFVDAIRIVIGTRWAMQDLYQYILDGGTHAVWCTGPYVDERARLVGFDGDDGALLFPEKLNENAIEQYRQDLDIFFSYQILNVPVVEGLLRFGNSDIRYYNWISYGQSLKIQKEERSLDFNVDDMYVTLCVDPALGRTAESDEFAITVVGWLRSDALGFVLDEYHGRINPLEQAQKIVNMHKKWHPHICGIEAAGYQMALESIVKQMQNKDGYYFYVTPLTTSNRGTSNRNRTKGGGAKVIRIESLQPFFANEQVYMNRNHGAIIKQLLGFQPRPDGSTGLPHDDLIDSLAHHVRFWESNAKGRLSQFDDDDVEDWSHKDEFHQMAEYGLEGRT